jgi:hypothetical protein
MQERRTTIRIEHRAHAQYCPSEDLIPKDGRVLNLSERGAGLLLRDARRVGERLTLTLFLPEETDVLTGTGVVRWSDTKARRGWWHSTGLEWLPFEDTDRHRLETFLCRHPQITAAGRGIASGVSSSTIMRSVLSAGLVWMLAVGIVGIVWGLWLNQQNRQLGDAIHQRNAVINQLEEQEQRLSLELGAANSRFAQTTQEVVRLDTQTRQLGSTLEGLTQELDRVQQSYAAAGNERDALIQRVLDLEQQKAYSERQRTLSESERAKLEQERSRLALRLSSLPELRLAIREAVKVRRQAQRAKRRLFIQQQREAERKALAAGNYGYLVREGIPTASRSTVWIRVHEPDAVASATPAASSLEP